MKPIQTWTVGLKNNLFGGLMPILDPFDSTKFYISDGWGSSFTSMKLRQLSLEDGKEVKSIAIKNTVRCLYFHPDGINLFVVSDRKIFQVNRTDFTLIKKYEKGIARYSDYISSNDEDMLFLMNWNSDFLFVYDYKNEKGKRKKMNTCRGIFKTSEDAYLIFCARIGSVQRYNLRENKVSEVIQTDIFYQVQQGLSGNFYLHMGKVIPATSNTHESIAPINQLDIYNQDFTEKVALRFDFYFETFVISKKEEIVYLIYNNTIWLYSLVKRQVVDTIVLNEKVRIAQLFDEHRVFISYEYDQASMITCWKF
ncbi:YncE family protein [Myroides odoratus]|uniref:Uncharacterized protein n=1 Tax=Myroides odoratus TaxID=256 RepID=A0A9Q7EBA6_MYROD|nr:hypothetical protein [Myroides odoratus]EHQ42913.1 hypothetical protein Myrod_2084 [Myroides odoratus DSM 2801]EKB07491.1 hypothetical protein HMPREF9716_01941 [Myroides odoratus CIP 103059]QQU00260.1 hypothetical protein I6I88_00350 [Myroides odoratus]WQD57512.1 hypothetical protein U0010_18685 [Myroides odoratus]STZ30178.1 Uncharacterised protein [Myroides odoratus]